MSDEKATSGDRVALLQKILAVQRSCSYLRKDKQGPQFQYVGSSDALGVIRPVMDEQGLLLEARGMVIRCNRDHQTKAGAQYYRCEIWVDYYWVDTATGAEHGPIPWYGMGLDDSEKAPGKAITYAEKMFLLKYFHIATDSLDPDSFQRKSERAQQPHEKPTKQAAHNPTLKPTPSPTREPAAAPAAAGEAKPDKFAPATDAQVWRLNDLHTFAKSAPKCARIAAALKIALQDDDKGELSKGAAGALIAKAKAALEPLGWKAMEERAVEAPDKEDDEPPPPDDAPSNGDWDELDRLPF